MPPTLYIHLEHEVTGSRLAEAVKHVQTQRDYSEDYSNAVYIACQPSELHVQQVLPARLLLNSCTLHFQNQLQDRFSWYMPASFTYPTQHKHDERGEVVVDNAVWLNCSFSCAHVAVSESFAWLPACMTAYTLYIPH